MRVGVFSKLFIFYVFIFALLLQTSDAFSKQKTTPKPNRTVAAQPGITFSLEPKQKWKSIEGTDSEDGDIKTFRLIADENIVLKFTFEHSDILSEVNSLGVDKSIEHILEGKNQILKKLLPRSIKLVDKKVDDLDGGKLLVIQTQYKNTHRSVERIEKYFMYPNETLIVSLEWFSDTNATLKQLVIIEMGNVKVGYNPTFGVGVQKEGPK